MNVNIAYMKLYREEKGCTAYSIVESDGIVPQTVAGRIKENPYVHDVMLVLPRERRILMDFKKRTAADRIM